MNNTTNVTELQKGDGLVSVVRFGAGITQEVERPLTVIYHGKTSDRLPTGAGKFGDEDVKKLAVKILGETAAKGARYYVEFARYTFECGPRIDFDASPTHALFITNINKLRAYAGVNNYDVINVSDSCHIVAIPRARAAFDAFEPRFTRTLRLV